MGKDNISKYNKEHGGGPGRPKGQANLITLRIRESFAKLLEDNLDDLQALLHRIAQEDPKGAVDLYIRISERFVPKLTQNQITDGAGEKLNVNFHFGKLQEPEGDTSDWNIDEV